MVLVNGVNAGFVLSRPTADPSGGSTLAADGLELITKDTSPVGNYKIIEIGWWCNSASEETNFEAGIYDTTGTGGNAGNLLSSVTTNVKGTSSGWKRCAFDYNITSGSDYAIGIQIDSTTTDTEIDTETSGGTGYDFRASTSLTNPFNGGSLATTTGILSIYALIVPITSEGNLLETNQIGINALDLNNVTGFAQGFTIGTMSANQDYNLTRIGLKVYKLGNAGNILISIRADDGSGKPTGSDLAVGMINSVDVTTNSLGSFVYTYMTPLKMLKGTRYHIVNLSPTSPDTSNEIKWKNNAASTYSGGFINYSGDSGANWSSFTGLDGVFEVYGIPANNFGDDENTSFLTKPCLPV